MNKKVTTTPPKNNFKHTELDWIPKDWEVKKLKDFGVFSKGKGITKKEVLETFTKGISCIRYAELYTKYNYYTESLVSRINKKSSSKSKEISHGTILFAGSGETLEDIGKSIAYIGKEKAFAGGDIITFDQDSNNSKFLGFLLNYDIVRSQLYKLGQGHSVVHIYSSSLKNVSVPLPTLPEQQAIADCLSTWDVAIDKQQQLINVKEQQHKGLRQLLLTGKKRLINPETGQVFDGVWVEKRLGEYFSERKETKLNNLPLLSIGENGVYPQSESNKKDTSNKNKDKYKRICPNDIGYNTMRLWQGRSALSDLEGIVSPAYTILKPTSKANSLFFSYLFKLNEVIHRFYRNSQGMVSDTLNCKYKDFSIIKLKLPSLKEQKVIAEVLEAFSKEIELLQQQLHQLQLQKKGLMQALLSGEKRLVS